MIISTPSRFCANFLSIHFSFEEFVTFGLNPNSSNLSIVILILPFSNLEIYELSNPSAKDSSLLKLQEEGFDYTIRNVLYPVFHYSKAVSSFFVEQKSGKIINIVVK